MPGAMVLHQARPNALLPTAAGPNKEYMPSAQVAKRLPSKWPKPVWHPPWKMYRVVSGHLGYAPFLSLPRFTGVLRGYDIFSGSSK